MYRLIEDLARHAGDADTVEIDDVAIADAARARGIGISALSPLHLTPRPERGLLLGYGRLPEPSIDKAVGALSTAIAPSTGKRKR